MVSWARRRALAVAAIASFASAERSAVD